MTDIEMPFVQAALGGVIGAVLGGGLALIGACISNRGAMARLVRQLSEDEKKHRCDVRRSRLEELHGLIGSWAVSLDTRYRFERHTTNLLVEIESSYSIAQSPDVTFVRIKMLAAVYFSDGAETFARVLEALEETEDRRMRLIFVMECASDSSASGLRQRVHLMQQLTTLKKSVTEYLHVLSEEIARI